MKVAQQEHQDWGVVGEGPGQPDLPGFPLKAGGGGQPSPGAGSGGGWEPAPISKVISSG